MTAVTENEDQTRECEDDDVSRADVRRQTNHQYRRLHDDAEHLDRHQNEFYGKWYTGRPEDVAPVMLVSVQVGQEEDQRRQDDRYTDRARNVEPTQERNQSQEVAEENEEEDRQQERHELIRLVSDGGLGNLVPNENDQRLERVGHALRRLAWVLLVGSGNAQEHPHHDREDEQHPEYRLGDGKVINRQGRASSGGSDLTRNNRRAVRSRTVFCVHGVRDAIQLARLIAVAMAFEGTAHKHLHSLALDVQNDGKWDVDITEEVDVVRVCNVVDNEGARYELFIVGVVSVIAVRMLVVSMVRVGVVVVSSLAVIAFVAMIGIRIAVFSAVSVGIVLGMLSVCVVLISVAMVLSQERCSREEKQGGKQGLE